MCNLLLLLVGSVLGINKFFWRFCFQLKLQAQEAETTRRGLERARQEIVRQVTAISAEKDFLEREVKMLFEAKAC